MAARVWMMNNRVTTVLDYAWKNGGVGRLVEVIWRI